MVSYQYDVVVVGAGPSGSMTARYAAMGGCRTLLIEKRQEIGSQVRCGQGLARHFVQDTLGLLFSVVMHETNAEEATVFLHPKPLGQVDCVIVAIPGEDALLAQLGGEF